MLTLITNVEVGEPTAKATTQRTNYPFNSFFEMGGEYFGLSSDGLFTLGGDDDNGTDIDAYIRTGDTDLGDNGIKQSGYTYLSMETDGSVYLKVTQNKDATRVRTYAITPDTTKHHVHREKLVKGDEAVLWGFEFGNVDGSNFSLTMMEARFKFLQHRSGRY